MNVVSDQSSPLLELGHFPLQQTPHYLQQGLVHGSRHLWRTY